MLRITGGTFRSRLLKTPETTNTKPTMDRVRAGVFSALSYAPINARVLDLFAGSGSYSFEALSRGAKKATLIELDSIAIGAINDNASTLKVNENINVLKMDVTSFLKSTNETFDIIFIDPPYAYNDFSELINIINNRNLLNQDGVIVIESNRVIELDETCFRQIKTYAYGYAKIYILRK